MNDPSLPLARMQYCNIANFAILQYCNHNESLLICVNLTGSKIKCCLPRVVPEDTNSLPQALGHLALGGLTNTFNKQFLCHTRIKISHR